MTKLVGILNLTPDSFFDGGKHNERTDALKQSKFLIKSGANIIDVGAQSTRPNAEILTPAQEWQRLENILPEVTVLAHENNVQVSLDSFHPENMAKALALGIDIINDVSGFENPQMIKLAANSGKKIVVMHNLGVPADKNKIIDENLDVIAVLINWMQEKQEVLLKFGIKKEQIIFDPGIGFGKNAQQSIVIIKEFERLKSLNLPIYIGHSNKSFLDSFEIAGCQTREEKTRKISEDLMRQGVDYLRLHAISN